MGLSLRQFAACIGVTASPLSALEHFFGYGSKPRALSLADQMNRLETSRHIHLNLIRVGIEAFSEADEREIDAAVQFTRDTFGVAGIALGRIQRYEISVKDSNFGVVGNDAEAAQLTDSWTVPNDGIDVFFVRMYVGNTAGRSPIDGPCDKDAGEMNGVVVEMNLMGGVSNFALAHELCHYLGCDHVDNPTSLMNPTVPNGAGFSDGEAFTMQAHCSAHLPCK